MQKFNLQWNLLLYSIGSLFFEIRQLKQLIDEDCVEVSFVERMDHLGLIARGFFPAW